MDKQSNLQLSVVKSDDSPTGYWIHSGKSGGAGVPATIFEIRLWHMYLEVLEKVYKLQHQIDALSAEREAKSGGIAHG